MDWLTFWSKIAEALAWPVAAAALVFLLRPEIKTLLSFLKRLKAGPLEAEFEREVKELRTEAEVDLPPAPLPPAVSPEKQKLLLLAQINPRSAILEAWQGIEFALQRLISQRGLTSTSKETYSQMGIVRALTRAQVLNPEAMTLYHNLRALRNQAAHVNDFSPTYDSALNYIELAGLLQAAIRRATGGDDG